MGKDRRADLRKCARCRSWIEDEGEFCAKCEAERLDALAELDTFLETGKSSGGWGIVDVPMFPSVWSLKHMEAMRAMSGTWVEYDDPLDQARADSLEGGE